jgi:hypothetical protein
MLKLDKLHNKDAFLAHCEIAAWLIHRFGKVDPAAKHHIRGAVREATKAATKVPGNDPKAKANRMSLLAAEKMRSGDFGGLRVDHAVPVSVINERVLALDDPTRDNIASTILRLNELAVITVEEHHRLRDKGFSKDMPTDWDRIDPLARYHQVGIEVVSNEYRDLRRRFRSKRRA